MKTAPEFSDPTVAEAYEAFPPLARAKMMVYQ